MGRAYKSMASFHLTSLLLVNFAVYLYTEVWPLALFNPPEHDVEDSLPKGLMWARFAVVTYGAVIVPLFIPFEYVAVDPEVCLTTPSTLQLYP